MSNLLQIHRVSLVVIAALLAHLGCRDRSQVERKSPRDDADDAAQVPQAEPRIALPSRVVNRPTANRIATYAGGAIALDVQGEEIVAIPLDPKGHRAGNSRIVATTVEIESIDIDTHGDVTWVAWIEAESTEPGTKKDAKIVSRAVMLPPEGAPSPAAPVTVARYGDQKFARQGDDGQIRVVVLEDGRAAIATASAPKRTRCEVTRGTCMGLGYEVLIVDSKGNVRRLRHAGLDGGPSIEIEALLDLGDALAVAAYTWHGGAVLDEAIIPYGPKPPRGLSLGIGRPPRQLYFTNETLVTVSETDYCPDHVKDRDECPHMWISGPKGAKPAKSEILALREVCVEGRPMREISHAEGQIHVPLDGVWTGQVLLEIESGKVRGRTCENDTIINVP